MDNKQKKRIGIVFTITTLSMIALLASVVLAPKNAILIFTFSAIFLLSVIVECVLAVKIFIQYAKKYRSKDV